MAEVAPREMRALPRMPRTRQMFGRRAILTGAAEVTRDNVVTLLWTAMTTHMTNRADIQYLYDYYCGKQPILCRTKKVRPEICNRIVENRANEIVSFKVGYLCGEPIQYVGRSADEATTEAIVRLNEMMFSENKAAHDQAVVEWQMICGTAFRMALPDKPGEADEAPFELYTLDPRDVFMVYRTDVGCTPLMGVKITLDEKNEHVFSVYTASRYFEVRDQQIVKDEPHALGMIPIFEYPANNARLGAFEIVLPLLDAINSVASNRMDGLDQFVQSFMKFINCDISSEDFEALKEKGAIKVKSVEGQKADVDMIVNELNQDQTQTYADSLYQTVLTICGMPNRNGGSSTSDTGAAVIMRDGWTLAEARAKDSELIFKRSEQSFLKLILRICRDIGGLPLRLSQVDMKFTRRNYENIQTKAQVLDLMLKNPRIAPNLAFTHCGMFSDPESAYAVSRKHAEEQEKKTLAFVEQQPFPGQADNPHASPQQKAKPAHAAG